MSDLIFRPLPDLEEMVINFISRVQNFCIIYYMNGIVTDLFTLKILKCTLIRDTISVKIDFIIYWVESPVVEGKRIFPGKDLNFALYFWGKVPQAGVQFGRNIY